MASRAAWTKYAAKLAARVCSAWPCNSAGGHLLVALLMTLPKGKRPPSPRCRSGGAPLSLLNPTTPSRCELVATEALVEGSHGSSWTTRERRRGKGWPDAGPPDNVIALGIRQPIDFEATVTLRPREHGEQAGLYAYVNELSWVKLVVEGAAGTGGVNLIFASQHDGEPKVVGKLPVPEFGGTLSLRLTTAADGTSATASYRHPGLGDGAWISMPIGLGWLQGEELERRKQAAVATLPSGWRAALATEQWASDRPKADVRFVDVRAYE